MILAVDVGNSNTTVGLFDAAGRLSFLSALETDKDKTKDRCAIDLLGYSAFMGRRSARWTARSSPAWSPP